MSSTIDEAACILRRAREDVAEMLSFVEEHFPYFPEGDEEGADAAPALGIQSSVRG